MVFDYYIIIKNLYTSILKYILYNNKVYIDIEKEKKKSTIIVNNKIKNFL